MSRNAAVIRTFVPVALIAITAALPVRASTLYEELGPPGGYLGSNVVNAGDLNRDGYPDFAAAAPYGSGLVRVYFGGADLPTNTLSLTGPITSYFGWSLAGGGDFNGDGYSDLAIGAPYFQTLSQGFVELHLGGPSMGTTANRILRSPVLGDALGTGLAWAGDVNADGFDDLLIGAPTQPVVGAPTIGKAYLLFGNSGSEFTPDRVFQDGHRLFAYEVFGIGDWNQDGYSDWAVGSYQTYEGGPGVLWLFFGGQNADVSSDAQFSPYRENGFGECVLSAGDVNGDGASDLAIGDPSFSGGTGYPPNSGRVYIFYGGSAPDTTWDIARRGAGGEHLGYSITSVGDLNADGYDDLLAGGPQFVSRGSVVWLFGGVPQQEAPDYRLYGELEGENYGWSLAGLGDVNGDESPDFIVGAPGNPAGGRIEVRSAIEVVDAPPPPLSGTMASFAAPRPNPARGSTTLSLFTEGPAHARVDLYDVAGRHHGTLLDEHLAAGGTTRQVTLGDLPAGLYWLRATIAGQAFVQRLVHLDSP